MTVPEAPLGGGVMVLDVAWLASRGAWQAVADVAVLACARDRTSPLLLDVRGAPFTLSAREAEALGTSLSGCPVVAILSRGGGSYWSARVVATSAWLLGTEAAAFQDERAAREWLAKRASPAP